MRKLFDIVRDDVWNATRHAQQPFTYGSPPGREDFYFAGGEIFCASKCQEFRRRPGAGRDPYAEWEL